MIRRTNFWRTIVAILCSGKNLGCFERLITAIASLPIAFAIPRWQIAANALSWCLVLTGIGRTRTTRKRRQNFSAFANKSEERTVTDHSLGLELTIPAREITNGPAVTPAPLNARSPLPLAPPKYPWLYTISGAFRGFFNFLTYLYLLRFPLIAIAIAALFFFQKRALGKMLAGAFDQSKDDQIVALGLTNILFVYTVSVIGHNVLGYSALRGTAQELKRTANDTNLWHHLWNVLCLASALPVPFAAWYYSRGNIDGAEFLIAVLVGTLLGCAITTAVHVLRRAIAPPGHKRFDEKFPFMLVPKSSLLWLENSKGLPWLTEWFLDIVSSFKFNLTRGYLLTPKGEHKRRLLPGHGLALAMIAAFSLVYAFVGYRHWGTAIVYVLLLLTWLCWLLSGLAFFLDKYRVPTLVTVLLFFAAAALSRYSDHYFNLFPIPNGSPPSVDSEYVLAERLNATERPIIVVAANGGGIQSAAWTARVLTGLTESFATGEQRQKFLDSIRLISGVSGGSVGTMFFVNEITGPETGKSMPFERIVAEAEDSGLEEVVWGLAYPDLGHAFAPIARNDLTLDRGHALEESWIKTAKNYGSPSLRGNLLEWSRGVMEGWRPAAIFNATIVETGERLQISTTPVRTQRHAPGRAELFDLFKADIRIATAARLSASFPYVTPAARLTDDAEPLLTDKSLRPYLKTHIVDGGYFDNSGLCALTEWLEAGLTGREKVWEDQHRPPLVDKRVLVIQIRGFPAPGTEQAQPNDNNTAAPYDPLSVIMQRGWIFQLYAPISTMMGVLGSGQQATNDTELDLLQKHWHDRGIEISTVVFQPHPKDYETADGAVPLSWHLRKQDKDLIDKAWKSDRQHPGREFVKDFMSKSQ